MNLFSVSSMLSSVSSMLSLSLKNSVNHFLWHLIGFQTIFEIKFTFTSFSRYFECCFFLNFVYSVIIMPTASKFAFENNYYNSFFYINTEYSIKYIIR